MKNEHETRSNEQDKSDVQAHNAAGQTGQKVEVYPQLGHAGGVVSVAFSPDGKQALSGSNDSTLKLWDIKTGKEIRTFFGHSRGVNSVAFSPDGKQALSGSDDGTLKLWDIETVEEIASFISYIDGEWIAITPDGYYTGSPKGNQYLNVRIGNKVYGMDQFAKTFYQPDVVKARLQGFPDPSL